MSWLDAFVSAVISAGIALLVTWRFGGWQAYRAEAAREDRAARTTTVQSLRALRRRLLEEGTRRQARQEGTTRMVRRPQFMIYDFQDLAWPVLAALDNPVMNRHTAEQAIARLTGLLGQHQIEYLRLLTEPPGRPVTLAEVSNRIREARLLEHESDTPVDRMFQSDDPALVQRVIEEIDEIVNLLLR